MQIVASLVCGLIFGIGLLVSGMVQPAKVLGFLDIFGAWDPSLLVVMGAALLVALPGLALARRQKSPLLADAADRPTRTDIDRPLMAGSAIFGIGWGLAGLCPGPAVVNLAAATPQIVVFVAAMLVGMLLNAALQSRSWTRTMAAQCDN
jgi:hypothetical protein